jgi:hypothetical protein
MTHLTHGREISKEFLEFGALRQGLQHPEPPNRHGPAGGGARKALLEWPRLRKTDGKSRREGVARPE